MADKTVITLTFGDQAENHVGMQQVGQMVEAGQGFNLSDLETIRSRYPNSTLHTLHPPGVEGFEEAYLLVLHDGVNQVMVDGLLGYHDVLREQLALDWDKKAFMYGRVVNKHARWNLCYDTELEQEPDYTNRKGRIYRLGTLEATNALHQAISTNFGPKAANLKVEGNLYLDADKNGIGWHGDAERRIVVAARLGAAMPIHYQWYKHGARVGPRITVPVQGGDIYIMSEKAVGTDWKRQVIPTLRHAAGAEKYTE